MREEIITALGTALQGVRGKHIGEEPVSPKAIDVDGHAVALRLPAKMSRERRCAKVDTTLRLRPRVVTGMVLTTTSVPFGSLKPVS